MVLVQWAQINLMVNDDSVFHTNRSIQNKIEMVSIEELGPQEHLLRKIEKYIDFSFIPEKVRHLYSEDTGRPSLDPIVLFKMVFIGYLFGIPYRQTSPKKFDRI